jgi:hypothetical protein
VAYDQTITWKTSGKIGGCHMGHIFKNEAAKLPLQIVTYRKFWKKSASKMYL